MVNFDRQLASLLVSTFRGMILRTRDLGDDNILAFMYAGSCYFVSDAPSVNGQSRDFTIV